MSDEESILSSGLVGASGHGDRKCQNQAQNPNTHVTHNHIPLHTPHLKKVASLKHVMYENVLPRPSEVFVRVEKHTMMSHYGPSLLGFLFYRLWVCWFFFLQTQRYWCSETPMLTSYSDSVCENASRPARRTRNALHDKFGSITFSCSSSSASSFACSSLCQHGWKTN